MRVDSTGRRLRLPIDLCRRRLANISTVMLEIKIAEVVSIQIHFADDLVFEMHIAGVGKSSGTSEPSCGTPARLASTPRLSFAATGAMMSRP